jgi:hypothetical protein
MIDFLLIMTEQLLGFKAGHLRIKKLKLSNYIL